MALGSVSAATQAAPPTQTPPPPHARIRRRIFSLSLRPALALKLKETNFGTVPRRCSFFPRPIFLLLLIAFSFNYDTDFV